MSVATARTAGDRALEAVGVRFTPARVVALCGVAVLVGAYLSVLYEILVITGDPEPLYYVAVGAVAAGTLLARFIRPRTAGLLGAVALVVGTYLYVTSLPGDFEFLALVAPMVDDVSALLGGLSVLRIINADVWALAAAPVPVFLAWYLGLRGRYVAAAAVGAAALGVVVLTGDATNATTLAGVAGATVAVAFGDCDRRGEPVRNADGVVVVLSAMVVLTLVIGAVPGATGALLSTEGLGFDSGPSTVESSLVYGGDSVAVTGPVDLSPEVRFTVEADRSAYWRVGTYDRYTGGGWVRTGRLRSYQEQLRAPTGDSEPLEQRFTAEADVAALPAANRPVGIDDVPVPVRVTEAGSFEPASPLHAGESYTVESREPVASPSELRTAGAAYPAPIEERYTQLPSSVPERVAERTARLTANAENPYDVARSLEWWLQESYDYSMDVERPRGNVADAFLFEMDAGYCTYFATTMVTMLRTQDVPARLAVGYTPGQQVDDDEWVVRGYNSHAWVEAYFPGHGWIQFDPTPSEPRESAERQRLSEAREDGSTGDVDTNDSLNSDVDEGTPRPTPTPDPGQPAPTDQPGGGTPVGGSTPVGQPGGEGGDGGDGPTLPSIPVPTLEAIGFGLLVLAGVAVGTRRTGAGSRLYRQVWLRRLPDGPPDAVVAGAYHRLVHLEERAGREKAPGETPRQFLAGADDRARRIGTLYERSQYGHGADVADGEEAAGLLAALLEERSRLPHLVGRGDVESR